MRCKVFHRWGMCMCPCAASMEETCDGLPCLPLMTSSLSGMARSSFAPFGWLTLQERGDSAASITPAAFALWSVVKAAQISGATIAKTGSVRMARHGIAARFVHLASGDRVVCAVLCATTRRGLYGGSLRFDVSLHG